MNLLIITSPSAWWKTTLQNELVKRGWKTPTNFTTRKPRSEKEKDEYVFITKKQFFEKLENGDFLEHTEYNNHFYAAGKHLPEGNVVLVADPVWRDMVMQMWARGWMNVKTVYINIDEETQLQRLEDRRTSVLDIKARQKDFNYMSPTSFCLEVEGTDNIEDIANEVEEWVL